MKIENPYPHFCTLCGKTIEEDDREEYWADKFFFCSKDCMADYFNIGIDEIEDIIYVNLDEE